MKLFPERSLHALGYAILRVTGLIYVLFGVLLYVQQDAYLFIPPNTPMEECPDLHDAAIISTEGTRAYYEMSGTSTKLAISYHGNGERACDSAQLARFLASHGYNVLLVEYAGYAGDTTVKPSVSALLGDVRHIAEWVEAEHFSEQLIVGRSIGTGFASYHASLAPPATLTRLILISPFDSLTKVAQSHFPMYPASLMLKVDLENVATAREARRVLIIHGTKDMIVPIARGKSLYDQLPQTDKTFYVAEGYEHNDVLDSPEAWTQMEAFLR